MAQAIRLAGHRLSWKFQTNQNIHRSVLRNSATLLVGTEVAVAWRQEATRRMFTKPHAEISLARDGADGTARLRTIACSTAWMTSGSCPSGAKPSPRISATKAVGLVSSGSRPPIRSLNMKLIAFPVYFCIKNYLPNG